MSVLAEPVVLVAIRIFLALLFVVAAVPKLRHHEQFFGVVRNFRLVPEGLARPLAWLLPVAELATAVALMVPETACYGALAAGGLLLLFAAAMAVNVLRGRTAIDCGCFRNGLSQKLSWALVSRNIALAVAALPVAVAPGPQTATLMEAAFATAAAGLALLVFQYIALLSGLPAARRGTLPLSPKG